MVSDDDQGAIFNQPVDRLPDESLRSPIDSGRRFIQNHEARVPQEDATKRKKLGLPCGQSTAIGPHLSVETAGEAIVPTPQAKIADGLQQLIVRDRIVEEGQIVADGSPEESYILGDHAHVLAEV